MIIDTIRNGIARGWKRLAELLVKPLIARGLSPNHITIIGLVGSAISAACYGGGAIFLGGVFLMISGLMDTLDGWTARAQKKSTPFGALFDSTLDRYAEFFVFLGILFHYRYNWMFVVVFLALMGSIMVSYVRARAHSLGADCPVGWAQRPERLGVLITGSILNAPFCLLFSSRGDVLFAVSLLAVAVTANITAIQRLLAGRNELSAPHWESSSEPREEK